MRRAEAVTTVGEGRREAKSMKARLANAIQILYTDVHDAHIGGAAVVHICRALRAAVTCVRCGWL